VGRTRGVGLGRTVGVGLGVDVAVAVAVAVGLAVAVTVAVGVTVTVGVAVAVAVGVGDTVTVAVAVAVAVGVGVIGGVGVGVHDDGSPWHPKTFIVSTRQPWLEPLVSLAIRQRNLTSKLDRSTFTTLVTKPAELPLQACRPAIGLPRLVLIVRL